jgi:hypothetical protein
VVDDGLSVSQLVGSVESLPAPPRLEHLRSPTGEATSEEAPSSESGTSRRVGPTRGGEDGTASRPRGADARAAEIATELAALEVATLSALGDGAATRNVMGSSELPTGLLDEAGRDRGGVRGGDDDRLALAGDGSGQVERGRGSRGLADLGEERGRSDATTTGTARPVDGPRGNVQVTPPQTTDTIPGAEAVVASLRGRFRACYHKGLFDHPAMEGAVTLAVKIGANGEVMNVSGGGGGLAPIVPCLHAVVRGAVFSAPESGGVAMLIIPIRFLHQSDASR